MLKLYGLGASQPCRAVWWACLIKGLPFKLCYVGMNHFGAGGPLSDLNPVGQVPIIEDDGYVLSQMPAILLYLSKKYGWTDFYPTDIKTAGLIDQYLHFHHNGTRRLTQQLMAPHVCVPLVELVAKMASDSAGSSSGGSNGGLGFAPDFVALVKNPDKLKTGQQLARQILGQLQEAYFRDTIFLCTDSPSIADIACYQEVSQLKWANLFDFEPFPKIEKWLQAMTVLPFHDAAHRYNIALGDIATTPNTLERLMPAIDAAAQALTNENITVESLD